MAWRSRNIKPSLFENEILGTADPFATILFAGLWCLADREGRLENRPLRISSQIFPYRNFSPEEFEALLAFLTNAGFIRRYIVGELAIIQVVKFSKHQSPHNTEKASELPAETMDFQQVTGITVNSPLGNGELTDAQRPDSFNLIPDSGKLIPERADALIHVFDHWREVHGHPNARFTLERKKLIGKRLDEGYTVDQLMQAINGCKNSPYHQGKNDTGTVYDDLSLILRNGTKVETFIGYLTQKPPDQRSSDRAAGAVGRNDYQQSDDGSECKTCFDFGYIRIHPDPLKPFEFTDEPCPDCQGKQTK